MATRGIAVRLFVDPLFWLAHLGALLLWGLGYAYLQPAVDPAWPLHQPGAFVMLVLVYPVVEEWVFRGALQGALLNWAPGRRRRLGISLANLITSLVFTGLHFLYHPPLAAAAVLVPSLIFGLFRDRHQRLLPAIWLHVFYNAGYFWLFTTAGA